MLLAHAVMRCWDDNKNNVGIDFFSFFVHFVTCDSEANAIMNGIDT